MYYFLPVILKDKIIKCDLFKSIQKPFLSYPVAISFSQQLLTNIQCMNNQMSNDNSYDIPVTISAVTSLQEIYAEGNTTTWSRG